ncbi:hypothetical protein K6V90_25035 [Cupriavidus pauculus]|uniref:hypothetical protein n=1 Tax=Cupriavidus pauculus TaxID=82633 RepID=UPI001C933387|nr:hypothetical protein [Cupriavidus pauculus]MBY4733808.1 hypothetical protein [Cupriavidus pauculus]
MTDRLSLASFSNLAELMSLIEDEFVSLTERPPGFQPATHKPLFNACEMVVSQGASSVVVQRRVQDPDFAAEYNAYYSRQFAPVARNCIRLHFFSGPVVPPESVLGFLDRAAADLGYLGFLTLRPVARTPVGASIFSHQLSQGFVRSLDTFPVHVGGVELSVSGTPFMQQDNAVGACAQASIWMALRTMRRREGDRAHDPAQITDAATRYFINGRIRPNREGLTQLQMTEAVRAAGYSPHSIPLGAFQGAAVTMDGTQLAWARVKLHAYIESEIPVLLLLFPAEGGHAVVAVGHTWDRNALSDPAKCITYTHQSASGKAFSVTHAVSCAPEFLVNNDNTGPYRPLPPSAQDGYQLSQTLHAIPLLPADVFMTGEEAFMVGVEIVSQLMDGLRQTKSDAEVEAIASRIVVRLLLVEKRRLRRWAADTAMPTDLSNWLRLGDLPKRVWMFELHVRDNYGNHDAANTETLVGIVLLDPTGDAAASSVLLTYFNLQEIAGEAQGAMMVLEPRQSVAVATVENGPLLPLRR